jgi:hypothetical protein
MKPSASLIDILFVIGLESHYAGKIDEFPRPPVVISSPQF